MTTPDAKPSIAGPSESMRTFEVNVREVSSRSGPDLHPGVVLFMIFIVVVAIVGVANGINSILHDMGRSIYPANEVRGGAFIAGHFVILGVALVLVSNAFGRILGGICLLISLAWAFGTPLRPTLVGLNGVAAALGALFILFGFPTRRFLRTIGALLIFLLPGLSILEQARTGSISAALSAPSNEAQRASPEDFGEAQEQERIDKAEASVRSTYASGGLSELRKNVESCYVRAEELNDLRSSVFCFAFHYMTGALAARDARDRFDPSGIQARANNHLKRFIDNSHERKTAIARWTALAKQAAARLVSQAGAPDMAVPVAAVVQTPPPPAAAIQIPSAHERQVAEGDSDDDASAPPARAAFDPSFECAGNSNPTEREICRNADLTRLDLRADMLFAKALTAARGQNLAGLSLSLAEWQRRRDACGSDVACIAAAYRARIGELEQAAISRQGG